jgi:diguanylate cyclase (GGDEF)-like protein
MAAGDAPAELGAGRTHPGETRGASLYEPLVAYAALLAGSGVSFAVFDRDLVVRDVSEAAAAHAGTSPERLRGLSLRDALPGSYVRGCERVLAGETVEGEQRLPEEVAPLAPLTRARMLPLTDAAGGVRGGLAVIDDLTGQRQSEDLIEKLAFVDPLTGLANRRMASMVLGRALSGPEAGKRQLALVWLNLDRFKDVNHALGHEAGDLLLRAVGERLQGSLREGDLVGRVGGDDFLLVLPRVASRANLERLVGRIHAVFERPFTVASEPVLITASCGVALHPAERPSAYELEEHAHTAMRAAKQLGGGACEFYDEQPVGDSAQRLRLVGEIREGIQEGHFVLQYQPQLELATMSVQAVEALVRWEHPERGTLQPGEFIAFAEESAMIVPLGRHILEQACGHHAGWHESLSAPPRLAINVSAREFQRTDVCGQVREVAKAAGISPSALEIEITETAVLADPAHAAEVAACLREAGASVALDDFGTGFSSLTHLRELPIDRVKIDRSFVASCLTDRSAAAILVAVVHLSHDLGLEVVAEGVETQAQLDFLRAVGCDSAQGYHLARPLSHADCTEYLLRAAEGPVM